MMKPLFNKFRLFALLLLLVIGITAVSCWRRGSIFVKLLNLNGVNYVFKCFNVKSVYMS